MKSERNSIVYYHSKLRLFFYIWVRISSSVLGTEKALREWIFAAAYMKFLPCLAYTAFSTFELLSLLFKACLLKVTLLVEYISAKVIRDRESRRGELNCFVTSPLLDKLVDASQILKNILNALRRPPSCCMEHLECRWSLLMPMFHLENFLVGARGCKV